MLHLISRILHNVYCIMYFQKDSEQWISSVIDRTEWMCWHLITNHIRRGEMSYWHMIFIHLSAQCSSLFINLQSCNFSTVLDLHWTKNGGQGSQRVRTSEIYAACIWRGWGFSCMSNCLSVLRGHTCIITASQSKTM